MNRIKYFRNNLSSKLEDRDMIVWHKHPRDEKGNLTEELCSGCYICAILKAFLRSKEEVELIEWNWQYNFETDAVEVECVLDKSEAVIQTGEEKVIVNGLNISVKRKNNKILIKLFVDRSHDHKLNLSEDIEREALEFAVESALNDLIWYDNLRFENLDILNPLLAKIDYLLCDELVSVNQRNIMFSKVKEILTEIPGLSKVDAELLAERIVVYYRLTFVYPYAITFFEIAKADHLVHTVYDKVNELLSRLSIFQSQREPVPAPVLRGHSPFPSESSDVERLKRIFDLGNLSEVLRLLKSFEQKFNLIADRDELRNVLEYIKQRLESSMIEVDAGC